MAHSSGSYRLFKNFVLHIVWDMSNVVGREDMKKEKGVNLECCEGEEVEKDFQHVSLDQNIRVL